MPEDALIEQLDQAIDALLAGGQPPTDPEIAALAAVAADLRYLPDEKFQQRLKSDLQRRVSMTASTTVSARESVSAITPFIAVQNAPALIEFLKQTFGAEETARNPHGDGFVASLRIGDSDVLVMGGESLRGHERIGAFHAFVPDCDAVYDRAIKAGGTSMGEPADRPYGERSGFVKDATGNYWYIATRFASNVAPEGAGSIVPYMHPSKALPFIDFLKRAFGAQEIGVYEHGGRVMHAIVRIGNAVLEMGEANPNPAVSPCTSRIAMPCTSARSRPALHRCGRRADQAYGERTAGLVDPFGFQWMPSAKLRQG
jgi:uncharacterized glyoxalase superfamily protein PhnB